MKWKYLLYLIIVIILAIFIFQYVQKKLGKIVEGARTYPMPRRHPLTDTYKSFSQNTKSNVISLNKEIDESLNQYFNPSGVPYINTIVDVERHVVGKSPYTEGSITPKLKSKLTDIGYYFLEIILPMIPTNTNPKPKINWPMLKWSGIPGFKVEIAKIPKYYIYKGRPEDNYLYLNNQGNTYSWLNQIEKDYNELFSDPASNNTSSSGSDSGSGGNNDTGCYDDANDGNSESCGIQCPQSCFEKAAGIVPAPAPSSSDKTEDISTNSGESASGKNNYSSLRHGGFRSYGNNGQKSTYENIATIGQSSYTGYDITQIKLEPRTENNSTLKNKIETWIGEYFKDKGQEGAEPTQQLKDTLKYYSTQYSPADAYHIQKLRDLIFYFMQVIVPGMPTLSLPHFYVQWRPLGKFSYQ